MVGRLSLPPTAWSVRPIEVLPDGQLRVTLTIRKSGRRAIVAESSVCDDHRMTTYEPFPAMTVALRSSADTGANPRRRTAITVPDVLLAYVQDELTARATGIWL